MKSYITAVLSVVVLSLFLVGCQFAGSSSEAAVDGKVEISNKKAGSDSKNSVNSVKGKENAAEEDVSKQPEEAVEKNQNKEESKDKNDSKTDGKNEANSEVTQENQALPEGLKIGSSGTLQNMEVKVINVREITVNHVTASKGKFIGVELEIVNNGNDPVDINSLSQLSLIVNDTPQDVALIETKGKLKRRIPSKESVTGEIAFDTALADFYRFAFKDPNTSESLVWVFTDQDIQK